MSEVHTKGILFLLNSALNMETKSGNLLTSDTFTWMTEWAGITHPFSCPRQRWPESGEVHWTPSIPQRPAAASGLSSPPGGTAETRHNHRAAADTAGRSAGFVLIAAGAQPLFSAVTQIPSLDTSVRRCQY